MSKKYNKNFERDFRWYLSMRHRFNFDGCDRYYKVINKIEVSLIQYSSSGVSGKEAFYQWDSHGKILPTKHPKLLHSLLKTKGSTNLHIKMYAEDRVSGLLPFIEFRAMCIAFKAPKWFRNAVEEQKVKLWKSSKTSKGL